MLLSSQLSFKSWNLWVLVATTPNPYCDMMALSTSECHPHCQRELCLLWRHWLRDLTLISDPSVSAFGSLSFKYPALDLSG